MELETNNIPVDQSKDFAKQLDKVKGKEQLTSYIIALLIKAAD